MPPDLISLRARVPFLLLFLLLPLNGAFSVLLLCSAPDARRPLAFQVEWIFISELAGKKERKGGTEGGRGGGRGTHSAFSFVSKGNHARILDGEKEVEGEEKRREREGGEPIRPTNRPELSSDWDKFFGGRVNAKGTYLFVPLCPRSRLL